MLKVNFYCTMTKICARIGMKSMARKCLIRACNESLRLMVKLEKG